MSDPGAHRTCSSRRLVESWLRAEFEKRQAAKKLLPKKEVDPNAAEEILGRERTQFTGFSRGAHIPTPNLGIVEEEQREKSQAQLDREAFANSNNAKATVLGEGSFVPVYPSRLGFNKTNPLPK